MRVLLDTCVLIPSPIRSILLQLAQKKLFFPLWSDKIIEEWVYFSSKNTSALADRIRIEILLMKAEWSESLVICDPILINKLYLPDENDRHVLASAIKGKAQVLLTNNLKDFPSRTLITYGIIPQSADSFLLELFNKSPKNVELVIQNVFELSKNNNFHGHSKRSFLKKYKLPRLAKKTIA